MAEIKQPNQQLAELQADLAEFEARHGMSSKEFLSLFRAGKTDDHMDFVEWASLAQIADNLCKRVVPLTDED